MEILKPFNAPHLLAVALVLWAAAVAIAAVGRMGGGWITNFLLIGGLLLIALAAGDPLWQRPAVGSIQVMVDLSPSTRGANYRIRRQLNARIDELLGKIPRHVIAFADGVRPLPSGNILPDLPADRTVFSPPSPPSADAILLFSDGQFSPPIPLTTPPVFAVIDPALQHPADAAITQLTMRGTQVVARVRNSGPARALRWTNARPEDSAPITADCLRIATPLSPLSPPPPGHAVIAQLSPGDRWPENDALAILPPPALMRQQWWIGSRPAPPGWISLSPAALPTDPFAYLGVASVVLDDIAPDALSIAQQTALASYAKNFGGGVVLIGGEHLFSPAIIGSVLDALSPLSPTPPHAVTRWIILGDGSGSMAAGAGGVEGREGGRTLWQTQADAIARLLPALPQDDLISIGSFAQNVTWWCATVPVRQAVHLPLPPANLSPRGPTNLQAALRQVTTDTAHDALPTQLLLITDADAALPQPAELSAQMVRHHLHLHVLAVGNGSALAPLRTIALATGGSVARQLDPAAWAATAQQLARDAEPNRLHTKTIHVRFMGDLAALGSRTVSRWTRTWLAAGATLAASGAAPDQPMAAQWQYGQGQVAATAYAATVPDALRLAQAVAAPPRDPRFTITYQSADALRITVDAVDGATYLNNRAVQLALLDPQSSGDGTSLRTPIPQSAPGRYELSLPPPRRPTLASVWVAGHVIDRFALPGRYPPEFNAVGNDTAALRALALQSGGAVIDPSIHQPISFPWPRPAVHLLAPTATLGAALIAIGLLRWRAQRG